MSKVLIVDSTYKTCFEAVEKVFTNFPIDISKKKVAIKVNALKAGDPDQEALTTNYNLLAAVIKKLESLNPAEILVGDSVGTESYGNCEYVFEKSRLKGSAGTYYKNFNTNLKVIELAVPFKRKVAVLKDVLEADFYISLPKFKTHGLTMVSGSIKNNFGLLTGAQKAWYHYYSVEPETFAKILIEMYKLRPPDLVIMDAIMAMEGYGPASPEIRWLNKVIASNDPVALDTVQAKIVGFKVEEVPVLSLARTYNLGNTYIENIEIIGDASTISDFHRPTPPVSSYCYKAGVGTGSTSIKFYRERVALRPVFDKDKCKISCTDCVDNCPFSALTKTGTVPSLDQSKCMLCSSCKEICNYNAVELLPSDEIIKELQLKEE